MVKAPVADGLGVALKQVDPSGHDAGNALAVIVGEPFSLLEEPSGLDAATSRPYR